MSYLITYLFTGAVFMFLLELWGRFIQSEQTFTGKERVFSIVVWPVTLFVFIREFTRAFKK